MIKNLPLKLSLSLIILLFSFLLRSSDAFAQCGTEMSEEERAQYLQHLENFKNADSRQRIAAAEIMYVPMSFHVVTEDDGTGGASLQSILEGIKQLNLHFANAQVQFYVCGDINYIASSEMYDYVDSLETTHVPVSYDVAETINIIYQNSLYLSHFGYAGGFAYYPGGPLRIHMSNSAGKYTLAHEMGHFWGLPHTFNNSDSEDESLRELVTRGAGANCSTAGDAICDTPADPYVHKTSNSYFYNCIYTDTVYDRNGDMFAPMVENIMSYYNGCSSERFTIGQMEVAASYKTTPYRSVWSSACSAVPAPTTLTATADDKYGVILNWQDNATGEFGYILEISEGTADNFRAAEFYPENTEVAYLGNLNSYTQYYFRIKPLNSAASFSNTASITTGKLYCYASNSNNCEVSNIIVGGNPVLVGIQSVRLEGETLLDNTSACSPGGYEFYNASAVQVYKDMQYRLEVGQYVMEGRYGVSYMHAWIDLNEDGTFDNDTEKWMFRSNPSKVNHYITDLAFDASVSSGTKRMRIRAINNNDTSLTACEPASYGETEDYLIQISDKPASFPLQLSGSYNGFNSIQLTWTNGSLPSGTQCIIYGDEGNGFEKLDTVSVNDLAYYTRVFSNGLYAYYLRNAADNTLISDLVVVDVSGIRYCIPTNSNNCLQSNYIINNQPALIGIKTVSLNGETVLLNETGCSEDGYDFYHGQITQVYKDINYRLQVGQLTRDQGNLSVTIAAWIDLNDDGLFDEITERYDLEWDAEKAYHYSTSLRFDPAVTSGVKRMRIRARNNSLDEFTSCNYSAYGETEDYLIEISDKPSEFPLQLTATYDGMYDLQLSWTNTNIPSGTECVVYIDRGAGFVQLGTVPVDLLSYYTRVFSNGEYSFLLRNAADNTLLTDVLTADVNSIRYCTPTNSSNCEMNYFINGEKPQVGIASVSLAGETILNITSSCSENGFDFIGQPVTKLYKGINYQLEVGQMVKENATTVPKFFAWIDLNDDGTFDESTEKWVLESNLSRPYFYNTGFNFDASVSPGVKRMRIRAINSSFTDLLACETTIYGETEDYLIEILEKPFSFPVQLQASYNNSDLVHLTWTNSGIPVGTEIILYADKGKGFESLDTLLIDALAFDSKVYANGEYSYLLRNAADNTLLSDIASVMVDGINYCVPTYSANCAPENDFLIEEVRILGETDFSHAFECSLSGYSHYGQSVTTLYKGVPYQVEVRQRVDGWSSSGRSVSVWVDYNQNGSFEDAGELFNLESTDRFAIYAGTIVVPEDAVDGVTTLRVRMHSYLSTITSCENTSNGETEDYDLTIEALPAALPVTLTATQEAPHLNSLSWTYTTIPAGTLVYVYRYLNGGNLVLKDSLTVGEQYYEDMIGGNGLYQYVIRNASDKSLLSNIAGVQVTNYQTPYQLTGAIKDNVVRLSWNVEHAAPGDRGLLYRSYNNTTAYFMMLDTVRLDRGYYDDIKYYAADEQFTYFLSTISKDTISNKVTVSVTNNYCIPTFNNTTCLTPLSTSISYYTEQGTYQSGFHNPYCYSTNRFVEPSYSAQVDTIHSETEYSFFLFFEGNCTNNQPVTNFRNVSIYLDYDHDGQFTQNEVIYANPQGEYSCMTMFDYILPADVPRGVTRMRYIVTDKDYPITDPCGNYAVGTGYDFFVYIDNQLVTGPAFNVPDKASASYVFPNPSADGRFRIVNEEEVSRLTIYRITGETIYDGSPDQAEPLEPGMYILEIYRGEGPSEKVRFLSK